MCIIMIRNFGRDDVESHCSECDMRFSLFWNRNPVYDAPQYCPFCGDEIEETIEEGDC